MSVLEGFVSFGTTISDVLNQWAYFGIFDYVLPFLLIFAIVYAILSSLSPFKENKGALLVIAIAVGLLSLQFDYVPLFFSSLFPYAGLAIGALVVVLILISFFPGDTNNKKIIYYTMLTIGAIAAIIVVLSSFSSYSWWVGTWWLGQYTSVIVGLIVLIVLVTVVALNNKNSP